VALKPKKGLFVGPWIRELIQNVIFEDQLSEVENAAWKSLKTVTIILLGGGRHKAENHRDIVADLVQSYTSMGCDMSFKAYFVDFHLDFFPEHLGAVSDEYAERIHKDISTKEKRYQDKCSPILLVDYCRTLRRDVPQANIAENDPLLLFR